MKNFSSNTGQHRQLNQARTLILILLSLMVVSALIVMGYALILPRNTLSQGKIFVRALQLEGPALVPSGRMLRNAGYHTRSVNLRHTPLVPPVFPDPVNLLPPCAGPN